MVKPSDVKQGINVALAAFSPSESNAQLIIDWIMPDIKLEELKQSLYYFSLYQQSKDQKWFPFFDPISNLFAQYKIGRYEKVVRRLGREWWKYIGQFVSNKQQVIDYMIKKRPELKADLYSNTGQAFIEYYTIRLYSFFDMWFHRFPRFHNGCGGVVIYGVIDKQLKLWGFYCRKCNEPIAVENLENMSYMKRKNAVRR